MREAVVVDMIRTPFGRAGQRGVFRTSPTWSWSSPGGRSTHFCPRCQK